MDLSVLEALAFSDNRDEARARLIAGTPEHDYWHAVHLSQRGALDEARALLDAWPSRHGAAGETLRARLEARLLVLRATRDLDEASADLRDATGVSHGHQPEARYTEARYPSALDARVHALDAVIDAALARARDLSLLTPFAFARLLERVDELDDAQRGALLARLDDARLPGALELFSRELSARGPRHFAKRPLRRALTLEQLAWLGEQHPGLRDERAWVFAVLERLAPAPFVSLERDTAALDAHLATLLENVSSLAPSFTSLEVAVRYQQLALDHRLGRYDAERLRAYLALPREASYLARGFVERFTAGQTSALTPDEYGALRFAPAPRDDEPLVRAYLTALLAERPGPARRATEFSPYVDSAWLAKVWAEARLLAADADVAGWGAQLDAGELVALRDRVEVTFTEQNPRTFSATERVRVSLRVKNVEELDVDVFRIDPVAHVLATRRDVDEALDLDGMRATHTRVLTLAKSATGFARTTLALELPECDEPGTYVIEARGNGRSSRALVRKGSLSFVARTTAAGTALRVFDERGERVDGATLWLDGRAFGGADAHDGWIVVPYGESASTARGLLVYRAITQPIEFERAAESYTLQLGALVEREGLVAGTTARVLLLPRLLLGPQAVPLGLVAAARVEIRCTNGQGITSLLEQPVSLDDDRDLIVSFAVPVDTTRVELALRGQTRLLSTQRLQELEGRVVCEVNEANGTLETEALHLARSQKGWVLSLLGRSGEPIAAVAINLSLAPRAATLSVDLTLETDAMGRIELGALEGITSFTASTPRGSSATFSLAVARPALAPALCVSAGEPITLPAAATQTPEALSREVSLVAVHPANDAIALRDESARVSLRGAQLVLTGLDPGRYVLTARDRGERCVITVLPAAAPERSGYVRTDDALYELSVQRAQLARAAVSPDAVRLELEHLAPETRVHVVGTRFVPSRIAPLRATHRAPVVQPHAPRDAVYLSNRLLGDEYRYVLDRRRAKRRPGLMVEKPALLLNPWAVRATSTDWQSAGAGEGYAASQAKPAVRAAAPRPQPVTMHGGATRSGGTPAYDFLAQPAVLLANLRADEQGVLTLDRAALAGVCSLQVVVVDGPQRDTYELALDEVKPSARDLRLLRALDPQRRVHEERRIDVARAGETLVIDDVRAGRLELVDSIARAQQLLTALGAPDALREFSFVLQWPALDEKTRLERYSQHACHELHLFLWARDPAFFARVVAPYLRNKRARTFVDRFLLGEPLEEYAQPQAFGQLNALEKALLAWALPARREAIARWLDDVVKSKPRDPSGDARLVDALLGAAALESTGDMAGLAPEEPAPMLAMADAESDDSPSYLMAAPSPEFAKELLEQSDAFGSSGGGAVGGQGEAPKKKAMRRARGGEDDGALIDKLTTERERSRREPVFRQTDRTQEWAETHWYKRRLAESGPELVPASRFLVDLARHERGDEARGFLSPHLAECAGSLPTAMAALALLALPFTAPAHTVLRDDARVELTLGGNALYARTQLTTARDDDGPSSVLVGQSYFRADDRWIYRDGEQHEKPAPTPLRTNVAYHCQVVVTNPTSARKTVTVLRQIPQGAVPLQRGFVTHAAHVVLGPYATWSNEYAFYFPRAGSFTHLPAQVTRDGVSLARAEGGTLAVSSDPAPPEADSFRPVAQRGSLDEVLAALDRENLAAVDLTALAWRMRREPEFDAITAKLAARMVYEPQLWAYALVHRNEVRTREWLAHQQSLLASTGGPVEDALVAVDPQALGLYEHLEYAPLVNARAHTLGATRRVLNAALDAQYRALLELVAHRRAPTDDDRLSAAQYLFTLDRVDEALALFDRVDPARTDAALQYAYLAAYAALTRGELAKARALAAPHAAHQVARWRSRFASLVAVVDEAEGLGAAPVFDEQSREQSLGASASRAPSLELTVEGAHVLVRHANLRACTLRFYRMDLELLFSRSPFVQGDAQRFSYIAPGHEQRVELDASGLTRVPLPEPLRESNLVVEAREEGARASRVHYAHDLSTELTSAYGQLRVARASTGRPLAGTYVKVYARRRDGAVQFYKDGYSDVRGRFDYASLSTDDLDAVERFALLLVSDEAGATVLECAPPAR